MKRSGLSLLRSGLLAACLILISFFALDISHGATAEQDGVSYTYFHKNTGGSISVEIISVDAGSLTSVRIPDELGGYKVEYLTSDAFSDGNCGNVEFIDLAGVREIEIAYKGTIETDHLPRVKAFKTNPGNPAFKAVDGVLFSKDGSSLLAYPPAKQDAHYKVPEDVRSIGCYAFRNAAFESIDLPKGLSFIDYEAFSGCVKLKTLTIPNIIRRIPSGMISFENGAKPALEWVYLPPGVKDIYGLPTGGGFEIRGVIASYAEEYAVKNGYSFRAVDPIRYEQTLRSVKTLEGDIRAGDRINFLAKPEYAATEFYRFGYDTRALAPDGKTSTGSRITFESSDPSVLRFEGGIAEALSPGTVPVTIRAAETNMYYAEETSISVTVLEKLQEETPKDEWFLDSDQAGKHITIQYGDFFGINYSTNCPLTYRSSNPAVASVDEVGWVTQRGLGTTRITVIAEEDEYHVRKEVSFLLTIQKASQPLCPEKSYAVPYGKVFKLGKKASAKVKLSYKSLDPKTAKVTKSGEVRFLHPGKVRIRIKAAELPLYKAAKQTVTITSELKKAGP